jgi:hypothetical protein
MKRRSIIFFLSQSLIVLAAMFMVPESGWQNGLDFPASSSVFSNQEIPAPLRKEINPNARNTASVAFLNTVRSHFFEGPVFEIVEEYEFNESREKENSFQKHLENLQYYSSLFFQKSLGACLSFLQKQTPELKALTQPTSHFYLIFQVFRL